ncbi:MAG TPA: hypothetical protein VFH57_01395, partial [Gammaproteobacteria bacterium]|nr:hypothetical protein [Gammaproteobacteria bacterium]
MKKSTAILLGATMALSGISACRASAPASTMTPVPTRYGVFSEALVPFGTSAPAESAALRRAISRYRAGGNAAQTRPLDRFLKRHPDSVWRIALLTNEGLAYAHAGKFSLALNRLEAAWDAGRSARGQRQRALVDKALAQLLRLHAAFGHA